MTVKQIAAVILAAGSSSRMGRPKQALQFEDTSLLRGAALAALEAGCSPVVVVTGANADVSRRELVGVDVREAFNPNWEDGMGSSISVGIKALLDAGSQLSAAVIMLCDQPHVSAEVVTRIVSAHGGNGHRLVASRYGGNFGVPALFDRSLFDELAKLDGPAGAKSIIARYSSEALLIDFPEGEIDIDTPEDYQRLSDVGWKPE